MNRMSERELLNLRDVGDRFITDVAKPSHVADKLFCLVIPKDDANCCLWDSLSHRIVGIST